MNSEEASRVIEAARRYHSDSTGTVYLGTGSLLEAAMKKDADCAQLRKLLADVFAAVVYENAGNLDNPFAYIWTKNFKTLKQRWEELK